MQTRLFLRDPRLGKKIAPIRGEDEGEVAPYGGGGAGGCLIYFRFNSVLNVSREAHERINREEMK